MSRVFERNKGEWWIDFKDARGVRHRKKVGPNKRVAQEVLDGVLGNVARRQHLGIIEESAISFADFAETWWRRIAHTLKKRTHQRWRGILDKHLKPAFPGSLRGITAANAEAYIAARIAKGVMPSTVNIEVGILKHALRRAVSWELLSRNPFVDSQGGTLPGLKPLKEPSGRTRFLAREEIDHLLAACDESKSRYLRPFVIVAMNTGMRRSEIISLTRRSVDWNNHLITLLETKNGEEGHVYVNDVAYETLKSLPTRLDGRLFPLGPDQVTMLFRRAVKRARLQNVRLHDLRHTFASYHAMSGVAARGLQALLRHKDARMTMRYSHLSDAYLRKTVDAMQLGIQTGSTTATTPSRAG